MSDQLSNLRQQENLPPSQRDIDSELQTKFNLRDRLVKLRNKARQVAQKICFCVRCDSEQDAAYFFGGEGSDGQGCQVISQDNCSQVEQLSQPEIQPPQQLPANRLTAIDYPGPPAGPPTRAPIYSGRVGRMAQRDDFTELGTKLMTRIWETLANQADSDGLTFAGFDTGPVESRISLAEDEPRDLSARSYDQAY